MQQMMKQKTSSRPSGTDGFDFSYRMVVDSRYTKVARGKSRLRTIFICQAFIYLVVLLYKLQYADIQNLNFLVNWLAAVGPFSLIFGEIGRRQSRINFLRAYIFGSSAGMFIRIASLLNNEFMLKVESAPHDAKYIVGLIVLLVEIAGVIAVFSLIPNMVPPKHKPDLITLYSISIPYYFEGGGMCGAPVSNNGW